jgi:asparagine synthase (glutamine-hydrolysing)
LFAKDVDICKILLKMAEVHDEPFADSSNIPTYLISKLAREHSKVILTGDGADELLGGYGWWYDPLLGIGKPGNYLKEMTLRVLAKSFFKSYQSKANRVRYGRRYDTVKEAHLDRSTYFQNNEVNDLLNINYSKTRSYVFVEENTLNDALNVDLQEYMAGDILVKTDRASMANSLELRSPFLDVDFASFCISLPASLKVTNTADKLILRKAYQDMWTKRIRSRNKQGFGAPVEQWLKKKSMISLKDRYFQKHQTIFSYLSFDVAKKHFFKDNYQTWILLVLSIWFEKNAGNIE